MKVGDFDHECTEDVICPYCGKIQNCVEMEFYMNDGDREIRDCDGCGKWFWVTKTVPLDVFTTEKRASENGKEIDDD